jgi:hypothetical protein
LFEEQVQLESLQLDQRNEAYSHWDASIPPSSLLLAMQDQPEHLRQLKEAKKSSHDTDHRKSELFT